MKQNFLICSLLVAAMLLVPLIVMKYGEEKPEDVDTVFTADDEMISVMKTANGRVDTLTAKDYIIGVLAAEIDFDYHDEALKAQAVAAYTYAQYMRENGASEEFNGAHISDDPGIHQGYLDIEERKEKWGDKFQDNEQKAGEIAAAVAGKMIYYDNKPILAVYHNLNSGKTESAYTVWKKDIPYLKQVESPGDRLCADYITKVELSYDEFGSLIGKIDGVKFHKDKTKWIGDVEKTQSGYVLNVEICSGKVSSLDLRNALGLNSCCFDIKSNEDEVEITVKGNGHMVGMSQYGADYMARQGSDYEEILKNYYSNVEIR